MKRYFAYMLIAFILLSLLGCTEEGEINGTGTTGSTVSTETGNTQAEDYVPEFVYTEYSDPMLELPRGLDYYFLCPEYDLQFNISDYMWHPMDSLSIPILSRKPIDPEEIKIVLPLEHITYDVVVSQKLPYSELQSYLYKSYYDWDWEAEAIATRLQEKSEKLQELSEREQAFLKEHQSKAMKMSQEYSASLNGNLPGSLSDFYCYEVFLYFFYDENTLQEESFSYMDVSWPGVSFRQECGNVSFYLGPETDYGTEISGAYTIITAGGVGGAGAPYGLAHGSVRFSFTVEKDMVLDRVEFLNNMTQLKHVDVILEMNGQRMDLRWDGATAFPVQAGTEVQLRIVYMDPRLATVVTGGRITVRLDYSCEGAQGTWVEYVNLYRYADCYELAAVYFDGVDVPGYYRDYYNPILGAMLYQ